MDMKKSFNYSTIAVIVLAVAVTVMAIGYANFTQDLKINGTANISSASWNVHFDEESLKETGNITGASHSFNGTTMEYSVGLTKPGDTYSFEIDVKNSGTFNAELSGITLTKSTEIQNTDIEKYLTYQVTYAGNTYTANASDLSVALNSSSSEKVTVTVTYVQPTNPEALPTTTVPVKLGLVLSYVQAAA